MPDPWYQDGLRFSCTSCGNCCSGTPGSVLVSDAEIEGLASQLDLANHKFREIYTRTLRKGDVSLREKRNGECIFYRSAPSDDAPRGCSVYPHRPRQCRTWPFWRSVVHSPERWNEETATCPGMNRGTHHTAAQILETSECDGTRGQG